MSRATVLLDEATAESRGRKETMQVWAMRTLGIDADTFATIIVELESRLDMDVGFKGLELASHAFLLGAWLAQRATRAAGAASESVS